MTTERLDGGEGILHIPSKTPTNFNHTPSTLAYSRLVL